MKIEIQSKKGLRTVLSIVIDKKTIQNKMEERLNELKKEVSLKGFRTGKVPTSLIKNQFGHCLKLHFRQYHLLEHLFFHL